MGSIPKGIGVRGRESKCGPWPQQIYSSVGKAGRRGRTRQEDEAGQDRKTRQDKAGQEEGGTGQDRTEKGRRRTDVFCVRGLGRHDFALCYPIISTVV